MVRWFLPILFLAVGCSDSADEPLDAGLEASSDRGLDAVTVDQDSGRFDVRREASISSDGGLDVSLSDSSGQHDAVSDSSITPDAPDSDTLEDCGGRLQWGHCFGDELIGFCDDTQLTIDCQLRGEVCHEDPVAGYGECVPAASLQACNGDDDCNSWTSNSCDGTTLTTLGWHCREGGCAMQRTSKECTATAGVDVCLDGDHSQHVTGASCGTLGCGLEGPITYCGDGCETSLGACAVGPAYDWTAYDIDPAGSTNPVCSLWGRSETEIYAGVCGVTPYRYNGAAWSDTNWPMALGIDGDQSRTCFAGWGEVYCVAVGSTVSVNQASTSADEWIDVSVSGAVVFAAGYQNGNQGLIVRFNADGSADEFTDASWGRMNAIVARSLTDVWAAGENDTVVHFDGTSWASFPTGKTTWWGTAVEWNDLWLTDPAGVVLVGESGKIERRTGTSGGWTDVASGVNADLKAVWGRAAGDLIVVGDSGTVLQVGSTAIRLNAGFSTDAHAVWESPSGELLIGATAYTILRGR